MQAGWRLSRGFDNVRAMPLSACLRPAHLLALGLGSQGCGSAPLRAPHPAQPLDEPRAVALITETFQRERLRTAPAVELMLSAHTTLRADVIDASGTLAVAYLTRTERDRLGKELPSSSQRHADELVIVTAQGSAGTARVLVLFDYDYVDDEERGAPREQTSITSRLKLRRDVLDFLACAKTECWR
jgi:hypothetical protein